MEQKNLSIREMQNLELRIMSELHKICEKNNIRYFLGYGSCIGAVRHNGFIPWDDDIDILVPEEDYARLIDLLKNNNTERFQIRCMENDKEYIYPYAKFIDTYTELDEYEMDSKPIGVYVDIFPMYGIPSQKSKRKMQSFKLQMLEYLCICARKKTAIGKTKVRTLVQMILRPLAKKIGIRKLNEMNLRIAKEHLYDEEDIVSVLPANYGVKEYMPKELFKERVLVNFESEQFYIMKRYHDYLEKIYGDYMKLPPLEKQVTHHHYNVKFFEEYFTSTCNGNEVI